MTILDERLNVVQKLTELFRVERQFYLFATVVSLVMLLGTGAVLIYNEQAGPAELTLMFGSTGLITYSAGRLLWMWNTAVAAVLSLDEG